MHLDGDAGAWFFAVSYAAPLLLSSAICISLLLLVGRRRTEVNDDVPRWLLRWSMVFVLPMVLAVPVLVPDFWLSIAWGRTLWWGANPYYQVPPPAIHNLPFDDPLLRMTYGPLWAHLAHVVTVVSRGGVLVAAVLWKLVLTGAWCGLLALVARLVRARPAWERCVAILAVGWLPLGVGQAVGEGHNDVVMVAGVLVWLLLLERRRATAATAALAAATLVKYVTAPLFVLDVLRAVLPWRDLRTLVTRARSYAPRALLAAALAAATLVPLFRSLEFFRSTADVRAGYFYIPGDAVKALGTLAGVDLRMLAIGVQLVFPVISLLLLARWWRRPDEESFRGAVAGTMLSVLLVAAGHVWPWYQLWLLGVAVCRPTSAMARWAIGMAITAPFPLLVWTLSPNASDFAKFQLPSLAAYGLALVWLFASPRLMTPAEGRE
jgi:hypothetical protein